MGRLHQWTDSGQVQVQALDRKGQVHDHGLRKRSQKYSNDRTNPILDNNFKFVHNSF